MAYQQTKVIGYHSFLSQALPLCAGLTTPHISNTTISSALRATKEQGTKICSTVTVSLCYGATRLVNTHGICSYRRYAAKRPERPAKIKFLYNGGLSAQKKSGLFFKNKPDFYFVNRVSRYYYSSASPSKASKSNTRLKRSVLSNGLRWLVVGTRYEKLRPNTLYFTPRPTLKYLRLPFE